MNKSNFKYHIRLKMTEELPKTDVRGIITVLKKAVVNIFQPLEDGTAVIYHLGNEALYEHIYDFRLNRGVSCLLYTSPSPRDRTRSRMPSSA